MYCVSATQQAHRAARLIGHMLYPAEANSCVTKKVQPSRLNLNNWKITEFDLGQMNETISDAANGGHTRFSVFRQ